MQETTEKNIPDYFLGIFAYYHDSAAALIHQGKIITAAQEERFTRKKQIMKKNILINLFLVIGVVSGTFLAIESFIENNLMTKIPVKFHFALPAGLSVLAQSSKPKKIPENYIAIVGDSYAQGKGDWLLEISPNSNDAYHSAHVLNQLTHRDVISFGKSGASSIEGWVREPIAKYQFIHDNLDELFSPPSIILAYFYAGNDLLDNVIHLKKKFIPKYGESSLNDDSTWNDFFQSIIKQRKVGPFSGIDNNLGWLPRATFKIIKNEFRTKEIGQDLGDILVRETGKINTVWVDGEEIKIPDNLQSPSLDLTPDEIELGFLVFQRSLKYLKQYFNGSQIVVVYIPSVLESYAKISKDISISNLHLKTNKKSFLSSDLMARSDIITARVKSISESLGLAFIDTRFDMREASEKEIIHGPFDWNHYNKYGYETLAQSINCGLIQQKIITQGQCIKTSPPKKT